MAPSQPNIPNERDDEIAREESTRCWQDHPRGRGEVVEQIGQQREGQRRQPPLDQPCDEQALDTIQLARALTNGENDRREADESYGNFSNRIQIRRAFQPGCLVGDRVSDQRTTWVAATRAHQLEHKTTQLWNSGLGALRLMPEEGHVDLLT